MAIKWIGGYDPNSGQPPDDSTGVDWSGDTDIPGQFTRGGGFTPKGGPVTLSSPSQPRGITLNTPGGAAANPAGPEIIPPQNRPINPTRQVGPFTGGASTAASPFGQPSGLPWWLSGPLALLRGNPEAAAITTAAGVMAPTPTAAPNRDEWPSAQPLGPVGEHSGFPDRGPVTPPQYNPLAGKPTGVPFYNPLAGKPGGNLGPGGDPRNEPPNYIFGPGQGPPPPPTAAPTVPLPPRRLRGAVAAQKPNLGQYSPFTTIDAPNVDPLRRARLGNPQITALDLSRLFGGRS